MQDLGVPTKDEVVVQRELVVARYGQSKMILEWAQLSPAREIDRWLTRLAFMIDLCIAGYLSLQRRMLQSIPNANSNAIQLSTVRI